MVRALIVDDIPVVRASLCFLVREEIEDCTVLEAGTGEDAVSLALSHRPDLILMDISLPGMTGLEATRRIKETTPESLVVILSLDDGDEHRQRAESAGATAFIPKLQVSKLLGPMLNSLHVLSHHVRTSAKRGPTP